MRTTTLIVLTVALSLLNIGCDSTTSRDAAFYNNRGLDYYNQGELNKAIVDYNTSIELDPQMAIAYSYRSFAYYKQGELEKSIADYNKARELGYEPE